MSLKDFHRFDTEDKEMVTVQNNIKSFVTQLNFIKLDGRIIDSLPVNGRQVEVTVLSTVTLIPHGLGRKFQGWHLVDIQGDARVWRVASSTANTALFLPLIASASVVVKLWVY